MSVEPNGESTIWSALNTWGQSLPNWQRYIVSRAVRDKTLTDEKIDEAYGHFLIDHGLIQPKDDQAEIPVTVTGRLDEAKTLSFSLKGLKNLKAVNAIPETAELDFGPNMTIVYGHNGAGKSGFTRVFSNACFSRATRRILPNVYSEHPIIDEPSADILISLGGSETETIHFSQGNENPTLLRISVFDSSTANIHLSKETPLGFKPSGFDVFDEVTRVIGVISERLETEITKRTQSNKFAQMFIGESSISKQVLGLSKDTDSNQMRLVGEFGEVETNRLAEIDTLLTELIAASPAHILSSLAAIRADIISIQEKIAPLGVTLGAQAIAHYKKQRLRLQESIAAAAKVDIKNAGHTSLTETGSEEWVKFIKAGHSFGEIQLPTFPKEGEPCLLCHRPLDEPSATLVKRFWSFLNDETRVLLESANREVDVSLELLRNLNIVLAPEDSRIRADIHKMFPEAITIIDSISQTFENRRLQLIKLLEDGEDKDLSGDILIPTKEFDAVNNNITAREKALAKGSKDAILKPLQEEHIVLRHRQVLSQNIKDILNYVADLKWIDLAQNKKRTGLTTRFVTAKQKELFQTLIEGRYKNLLKAECELLNCVLPVEFKARGSAGQTLRGLNIQGGHKPTDILSEGEQRAVSIADFLTEVNLNPASAAVIFDDPVTSMDHARKRLIADRLAEESKNRQVVIFTHDLVFLSLLMDKQKPKKIDIRTHWVEQGQDGRPGVVSLGECPANSNAYKTTHRASYFHSQANKTTGQARVDHIRNGAGALRKTIEEIVIRDIFKGAVARWDEQVKLGNLKGIVWSDEVADEIQELQAEISRLIEGHSNSDAFAGGMPEPSELEALIDRVNTMALEAKKKRK